jgi:hypothetical protein
MNKPRKIIWTVYLVFLFLVFLNREAFFYRDIRTGSLTSEKLFDTYLYFAWIPALILHFVWRGKKKEKKENDT